MTKAREDWSIFCYRARGPLKVGMECLCPFRRIKEVLAEANLMDSSLSRTYVYNLRTGDFRVAMPALAINHDRLSKHQGGVGTAALDACSQGLQARRRIMHTG